MKIRFLLAILVAAFVGSCYKAGDLGSHPFCCNMAAADPNAECPDGYYCDSTPANTDRTKGEFCQAMAGVKPAWCLKLCASDSDCVFADGTSTKCLNTGLCAR